MPEGVEVRLLSEDISRMAGRGHITHLRVISGKYKKKPIVGTKHIQFPLFVHDVGAKGNIIWWNLGTVFMIVKLVTGIFTINDIQSNRIAFALLTRKGHPLIIYLSDEQNQSVVKFVRGSLAEYLPYGADMFAPKWSHRDFASQLLRYPYDTVANVLMAQNVVAGLGPYITTEALYLSKIAPLRTIETLSSKDIKLLHLAIKKVAKYHYSHTRLTLDDARGDIIGHKFKIYNKQTDKKRNRIAKCRIGKDIIYYAPAVQR